MMLAARTAPKARGIDNLEIAFVESHNIEMISQRMKEIGEEIKGPSFLRDADNKVMYTVGLAVAEIGLLGKDVKIVYGIPLSCTAKNPFFDRK